MGKLREMSIALGCDMTGGIIGTNDWAAHNQGTCIGRQGFATADDARADAGNTITEPVTILEHRDLYAWAWPEGYVERLMAGDPRIRKVAA